MHFTYNRWILYVLAFIGAFASIWIYGFDLFMYNINYFFWTCFFIIIISVIAVEIIRIVMKRKFSN